MIVSDHQTNSHSYVCALAPFSSGAVPQRPLKAKELTGQGFKPISSSGTVAITAGGEKNNSLCHPPSKGGFIYVGCTCVFFRGERRVTAKNSHQLACHFSVVFRQTLGFSETSVHLVSVVKTHFTSAFILRIQQISFQLGISVAHWDKTCAICFEMRRQVRIIACIT